MQNQETVLRLPNHSQQLAEIGSRPARPNGGGGGRRKTKIRRVRWEEGGKEKAVELRNEYWYMPLEEFRQRFYPDRTIEALKTALHRVMNGPAERGSTSVRTTSPRKRRKAQVRSHSEMGNNNDTGPEGRTPIGPQSWQINTGSSLQAVNSSTSDGGISMPPPPLPLHSRAPTSPAVDPRTTTAPTNSASTSPIHVPDRPPWTTTTTTTTTTSQVLVPAENGTTSNKNLSPPLPQVNGLSCMIEPETTLAMQEREDTILALTQHFINDLQVATKRPPLSPTQSRQTTTQPVSQPSPPPTPTIKDSMHGQIVSQLIHLGHQIQSHAEQTTDEVHKLKEEASRYRQEKGHLQEENRLLKDRVDQLQRDLQQMREGADEANKIASAFKEIKEISRKVNLG